MCIYININNYVFSPLDKTFARLDAKLAYDPEDYNTLEEVKNNFSKFSITVFYFTLLFYFILYFYLAIPFLHEKESIITFLSFSIIIFKSWPYPFYN